MKNKSDLGKCKIAKHRIELEPEAIPHREGARRMSPDKAAKANQEVQNMLALGLIQPSYSPWASGIVMVKKKSGELRFCCDIRPLNNVTVKDAFPLPRIDESLSRIGNAKIFTSIDSAWAFWQIPLKNVTAEKPRSRVSLACLNGDECPLGCQWIGHLSAIDHKSSSKDPTKTWKCRHGVYRRHSNSNGDN